MRERRTYGSAEGLWAQAHSLLDIVSDPDFLIGLRPGDKLKPIITATIYLGEEPWTGPRELHDVLEFPDERLKKFVPNYKLNLIDPHEIPDEDFTKLGERDLGFFMRVLKHQREGAAKILYEPKYEQVDLEAASAANDIAKLGLKIVVEKGAANMCRSMKEHDQETRILELIDYLTDEGKSKEEIISKILKRFPVTAEYVESLMAA